MNTEVPNIFTCPKTQIKYKNDCPVVKCPANVAHLKRPSGCVYNFLQGKIEIGVAELAYVFKLPIKEVKAKIVLGEYRIKKVLLLNTVLIKIRARAKLTHCPKCGVIRSTAGLCMRTDQCDTRLEVVSAIIAKRPLNIPELLFTKEDMFRLLNERRKINTFLSSMDTDDKKLRFRSLLSLSKRDFKALLTLRTIV